MSNLYKKISNYYNSLSSKGKLILITLLVLILAIIYYLLARGSFREGEINYKDFNIQTAIDNSDVVYERGKISKADETVQDILDVNTKQYIVNGKVVTVKQLYKYVVSNNYKKVISYHKFKKLLNNFYKKMYSSDGTYSKNYIDKVYYYSSYSMYIVKLNTLNGEDAYIGIIGLDNDKFTIGYIE